MKIILTMILMSVIGFFMQTCSKSELATKSDSSAAANSNVAAANKTVMTPAPDAHNDDAPRINLEEAKKDFDNGKAIFVDTRAETAYNVEHIKGAINITAEDLKTRYTEVPKDKKIIAYCS